MLSEPIIISRMVYFVKWSWKQNFHLQSADHAVYQPYGLEIIQSTDQTMHSLYISSSKIQGKTSDHYLNRVVFLMEWSDVLPD